MMFLLNTACRGGMDPETLKLINNGQNGIQVNQYRYTRPRGTAWETLLKYTYENLDRIDWSEKNQQIVTAALYTWTQTVHEGKATRLRCICGKRSMRRQNTNMIWKIMTFIKSWTILY